MREKRSTNKYDVYKWVIKVINSCNTTEQYICAHNLLRLFDNTYNEDYLAVSLRYISRDKLFKLTDNGQTTDSDSVK